MERIGNDGGSGTERLYRKMGEPSWLILRAVADLADSSRSDIARQVQRLLTSGGGGSRLDPSTLHYALQRMLGDGLIAEAGAAGHSVGEPAATYTAGAGPGRGAGYRITPLGEELLALRRRRIAVEVTTMDTPKTNRPKPSIFGLIDSGHSDLSEKAGEERPEPRAWRS